MQTQQRNGQEYSGAERGASSPLIDKPANPFPDVLSRGLLMM